MPIAYTIDQRQGIIRTIATGVLTNDELIAHKKKIVADPAFKRGMVELSDVRAVDRLEVTAEGVMELALLDHADRDRLGDFKLAIVVSQDVVFGMGRMYQTRTSENPLNVNIFRDMQSACEWLGIAPDRQ